MEGRVIIVNILFFVTLNSTETPSLNKWYPQWVKIAQEDKNDYHQAIGTTLHSTVKDINNLLASHATYAKPKFSVFNNALKDILNKNTAAIHTHAKKFAREIKSEAQNTFNLKIKEGSLVDKINKVKNTRKIRKTFINNQ